jgi:stage II sporulation protein M
MKKILLKSINKIKKEKKYIYSSAIIFLSSTIIGYILSSLKLIPKNLIQYILEYIEQIISQTQNFNQYQLISFIFFNNSFSCFFAIFYSQLFSFFSVFSSILNGFLIGFVTNKVILETQTIFSLWQLLPHGIFEIPAVLISMGLGLSFGFKVLEKKFKIKRTSQKIIITAFLTIIFTSLFFFIPYTIIATLLFLSSLIFFIFVIRYDKQLKKEFYDHLKVFITVILPLLIFAAIIEGLLIYLLK